MSARDTKIYRIAFVLALLIAGSAFVYKNFIDIPAPLPREVPILGKPGSTHLHASLLLMIGNRAVNFCDPKYMLKSPLVHFENNDCATVHTHATGVTLPTFLKTIGVELSNICVTVPKELSPVGAGGKYCNGGGNILRVVINGSEVPIQELSYHELTNNEHILINFGPEHGVELKFKYNQVPMIPRDVNEPLASP